MMLLNSFSLRTSSYIIGQLRMMVKQSKKQILRHYMGYELGVKFAFVGHAETNRQAKVSTKILP